MALVLLVVLLLVAAFGSMVVRRPVVNGHVVRPGDTLVLLTDNGDLPNPDELRRQIAAGLPDVRVIVVCGGFHSAVVYEPETVEVR